MLAVAFFLLTTVIPLVLMSDFKTIKKDEATRFMIKCKGSTNYATFQVFYGYGESRIWGDEGDMIKIEGLEGEFTVTTYGAYKISYCSEGMRIVSCSSLEVVYPKPPRFVKATALARRLYPDADEEEGFLKVIE